jgi:arylsulfatase A-like enzyme
MRCAELHTRPCRNDYRAHPQPQPHDDGRIPGSGGGLPAAEWTLASVLKTAGYQTFFAGKWHLGEADYALPNAHGWDEMKYAGLYHLNAYTYADPTYVRCLRR